MHAMKELKNLLHDFQEGMTAHVRVVRDLLSKNAPNLKPMITYYETELHKLKDELISDKTVQEISDFM